MKMEIEKMLRELFSSIFVHLNYMHTSILIFDIHSNYYEFNHSSKVIHSMHPLPPIPDIIWVRDSLHPGQLANLTQD